jgi:hypothetical protein
MSEPKYGFAQIEPKPMNPFRKFRVWYFKPGEKETHTHTDHWTRKGAEARAAWWLKQSHIQIKGDN